MLRSAAGDPAERPAPGGMPLNVQHVAQLDMRPTTQERIRTHQPMQIHLSRGDHQPRHPPLPSTRVRYRGSAKQACDPPTLGEPDQFVRRFRAGLTGLTGTAEMGR